MTNRNCELKPSILIIQENGRHERNRQFRECFCLQRAFLHLGVRADVWGKNHNNFHQPFEDLMGNYDIILSMENYDSNWHPNLSGIKTPKAFWCIDAHMGFEPYMDFAQANRFDIIFSATEAFVDRFKKYAGKSIWLPNAYDSFLIDKLFNVSKTIPLGFCGNTVNRKEWIDYLKRRWGLHHDQMVIGPDMVRAVNSYQIHWNLNVSIDINYRTFETLGCCTFLLTSYTPGIENLFRLDDQIVVYRNRNDLDEKIAYYQSHPDAREKIAVRGYQHVRRFHTYIQRAEEILKRFGFEAQIDRCTGKTKTPAGRLQQTLSDKHYLFVSGATKSGTTLLANALDLSDRISFLKNNCGKIEEGQWLQNLYKWGKGKESFSETYHMTEAHPLVSLQSQIELFHTWQPYWDFSKPILAEKSPHNLIKTRFLQALFPKSQFVILIRNGIVQATGEALQTKRSPIDCSREWVSAYQILLGDLAKINKFHIVRYEDLTNRVAETFSEIWDFIGVPQVDVRDERFFVHAFKNGVKRNDFNKITDMNKPHITNFMNQFDSQTKHAMIEICQPIMDMFGYSTEIEKYHEYMESSDPMMLLTKSGDAWKYDLEQNVQLREDSGSQKPPKCLPDLGSLNHDGPDAKDAIINFSPSDSEKNDAPELKSPVPPPFRQTKNVTRQLPVAIVTETMNYVSGGVRCIAEVLNRLRKRGIETVCYVTHPDLRCEWLEVEFPILPVSQFQKFKGIAISPYSPTAEIVAHSNAVAKFYWVHSYEPKFPELTGRSDKWRRMSEASYRLEGMQYFAVSSYVKMILELIYGRKVLSPLVSGGVDTALFSPALKSKKRLRIMFLSREHSFRGARDIIKALENSRSDIIETDVYVMGCPIDMGSIPHRLLPPLPQIEFARLLGSVDIFIHASHFEGLPLPPLEAMACKCAVIATYVGASDYLLDGYNALVVPPQRPDKIAAALMRLINNPNLRLKLAEGGFQTVQNGYTWEHAVDRFEEALDEGLMRLGCKGSKRASFSADDVQVMKNHGRGDPRRGNSDSMDPGAGSSSNGQCTVSAIVSAYNAERFIRGCLMDLENQTIADQIEIIVVNSGSQQNEEAVVKEFQQKYKNIKYLKTERRESVYASWNRGIRAAAGKYITNANTDDRHAPYAFERLAKVLDERPDIALVYANLWITETENETFEKFTPAGKFTWMEFDPQTLIEGCYIGPQPMWRKSLHQKYGYFEENYESAGDWEFWLRISKTEKFLHLKEVLGLYLKSPTSIEHRNPDLVVKEAERLQQQYK